MVKKVSVTPTTTNITSVNNVEHNKSTSSIFAEDSKMTSEEIRKIEIELATKKVKLEKLEKMTYEDYQSKRNVPSVLGGSAAGFFTGAALGAKIGSASLNPAGIIIGAAVGGIVGIFAGGLGGAAVNDALTPEQKEFEEKKAQDILQLQQEIEMLEKTLNNARN